MTTIHSTLKQIDLTAGGPGSGRKPSTPRGCQRKGCGLPASSDWHDMQYPGSHPYLPTGPSPKTYPRTGKGLDEMYKDIAEREKSKS